MSKLLANVGGEIDPELAEHGFTPLIDYYESNAPERLPVLPNDLAISRLPFESRSIGNPPDFRPKICNVNIVDLDQDKQPEILVSDCEANRVSWLRQQKDGWSEISLASLVAPAHTEVFDFDGDGDMDIAVAVLGYLFPTDKLSGSVVVLVNDGKFNFTARTLVTGVPRVADVQPGDFDGDGDLDLVVAMFGWIKSGKIGWLEQKSNGSFELHDISELNGTIHVPTIDINKDGRLDFIALIAQEHERINAYINMGNGRFEEDLIYYSENPSFGSSGIQLVDLDKDGDMDILYNNGDSQDKPDVGFKPYHGIQWLENEGNLKFKYHDILRFYGVYRAIANDMDNDGDLDIVAVSMANDWKDPARQSVIWLENDGRQNFMPWSIATKPTHLVTAALGDLTGDGLPEIVAGGLHISGQLDRKGRVTLWINEGIASIKGK